MRKIGKRILGTLLAILTIAMSFDMTVFAKENDFSAESSYEDSVEEENLIEVQDAEDLTIVDEEQTVGEDASEVQTIDENTSKETTEIAEQTSDETVAEDAIENTEDLENNETEDVLAEDIEESADTNEENAEDLILPDTDNNLEEVQEAEDGDKEAIQDLTDDSVYEDLTDDKEELENTEDIIDEENILPVIDEENAETLSEEDADLETEDELSLVETYTGNDTQIFENENPEDDSLVSAYIDNEVNQIQNPVYNASSMSGDRLSGINKKIYDKAKLFIGRVAAGQETKTQLKISFSELGIDTKLYSASDLGVTPIATVTNGNVKANQTAVNALLAKTGLDKYDSVSICNALSHDCAYEGYWIKNITCGGYGYSVWKTNVGDYKISIDGDSMVFNFEATREFAGTEQYTVDTNKTRAVSSTINNVTKIINEAASLSDYDKFIFYKNKICSLTELESYPEGNSRSNSYGIVSVFDGNPDTITAEQGYSRAFAYLCERTNFTNSSIKCYMPMGYRNSDRYFWNIVRLADGKNYLVDLGECDKKSSDKLFLALPNSGSVKDGYTFECNGETFTYYYDDYTVKEFSEDELTLNHSALTVLKGLSVNYPAYLLSGVSNTFTLVRDGGSDKCKFRLDYVKKDGKNILGDSYKAEYVDDNVFNINLPSEGTYEIKFSVKDFNDNSQEKSKIITVTTNSENGLVQALDGEWYYLKDGIIQSNFTGFVERNGVSYYVQKGTIKWGIDGLANIDGTWYYLKNSALQKNYTGLVNHSGNWYYVQKGVLKWGVRTLVQHNGTWYYVNNSTVDWNFTGIFTYNKTDYYIQKGALKWGVDGLVNAGGTWCYLKNSAVQKGFTGLAQNAANKNWYYVQNGIIKWGVNTLVQKDGTWYYVNNSTVDYNFTGIVNYNKTDYYIQKGILKWGVDGLVNAGGTWYYLKNSVVQNGYTGLAYNTSNKNWYYVQKGTIKWGEKTLVQHNGTWYYVNNSTVDFNFTGIFTYNGTDYYIQSGSIKWGVDGLTNVKGTWYYLKNSAVQKGYTGLVQNAANKNWYYVQKGIIEWGVKTVVQYNGTWYYVNNSTVDWNYTGLVQNIANNNWYYVQKGTLKWGVKTLVQYNGKWYYVNNSTLDWNYTGLCEYNGTQYYIQKGELKWGVNGRVNINGNWYNLKNSAVVK